MNNNIRSLLVLLFVLTNINCELKAQEKVLLSTDRNIYIAGENIRFNVGAYKLNSNQLSNLSQVVYVELINDKGVPVIQVKTRINKLNSQSQVLIPDTLSTGNYCLRAYTRWMKNKDISLFSKEDISIVNPFATNFLPSGDKYFTNDTIFTYPESGMLFPAAENKMLIRALNPKGEGKCVEGYIEDDENKKITVFKTDKEGYGLLSFIPESNSDYYYCFNDTRIQLPTISEKENYLKLFHYKEGIFTFKVLGKQAKGLWLDIVKKDGEFVHRYSVPNDGEIQVKNQDEGILFALLVDEKKNVLAYRAFSNSEEKDLTEIKLKTNQYSYKRRSEVEVNIEGVENLKDISVSVVKSCLLRDKSHIVNDLEINDNLLVLNSPKFLSNTPKKLMLPEVEGELITGNITNIETGEPIVDKKFMLSFISKEPILKFSTTDSLGRFKFVVNRYGEEEMVIQPVSNDTTLVNYKVNLIDNYASKYNQCVKKVFVLDSSKAKKINDAIVNMQISTLYSSFKAKRVLADSIQKQDAFYGKPNVSRFVGNYIELPSVEEVVREIVSFTWIRKDMGEYYFRVYEDNSLYPRECSTLTFVDGVPIKDVKNIFKISPQELERIDVVNLGFFLQDEELGYLLCFYTKDENMAEMEFDQRIFRQVHKGFIYNYQFRGPNYSDTELKNSRLADFRNVLYYNVFKGNNESLDLNFFTADEESEYTIVVKGINEVGEFVEKRKNIVVLEGLKN
ncbi:hypothetical protein ACXR6G_13515 [Ancylomarina sp. YFZ004]